MAVILSSKTFDIPNTTIIPLAVIEDWFEGIDRKLNDCRLTVRLESLGEHRRKKKTAKSELESLAVDASLEGKSIWKDGEYSFDFLRRKYFWKDEDIHITVNEALFLFRWLVLKDEIYKVQWYYLRNIRRRLGPDFLKEVSEW